MNRKTYITAWIVSLIVAACLGYCTAKDSGVQEDRAQLEGDPE